ncbi:MAG: methyltransferase domain-containing protein [Bdellovibrionota bacterium]
MIEFSSDDPFPLLLKETHSYADAQAHSEKVDRWLGLKIDETESMLIQKTDLPGFREQQLWIGLPAKKMLTPYSEIRAILELLSLPTGSKIVDLGAGYGRMGFVIGRHFREVHFVGYEYVNERVAESNRCLAKWQFKNVKVKLGDLSSPDFKLEPADFFFIYDYGTIQAIEKTLADLKAIARKKKITVIGRGRLSRDTIERAEPWLSQMTAPQHFAHFSIYQSR